jgi:ABC-type multidrug transport system ATPase subunit
MRALAAEGRTVLVSSHLMSEMALTADHLLVIGKGRLKADTGADEFTRSSSQQSVHVRSPRAAELAARCREAGAAVRAGTDPTSSRSPGWPAPKWDGWPPPMASPWSSSPSSGPRWRRRLWN